MKHKYIVKKGFHLSQDGTEFTFKHAGFMGGPTDAVFCANREVNFERDYWEVHISKCKGTGMQVIIACFLHSGFLSTVGMYFY